MADNNYRTMFHIMPPKGWLNDPNGLCYYKNMYHVFFQYSPDNANGGDKYWGHYTSDNLVEFKFAGISVSPDTEYDKNGAYSGSAFIKDDELYVYYTGNVKTSGEHDIDRTYSGRTANTILIKSKDGMNFGNKKLLMNNDDYPNEYTCHVRDPKVWTENGKYFMIQGGRIDGRIAKDKTYKHDIKENREKGHSEDIGAAIIFQSDNLENWNVLREIKLCDKIGNNIRFGYMWECPDYFKIAGLDENSGILSLCPQGLEKTKYQYQNIYQSGYFIVQGDILDRESKLEFSGFSEWDMGFDFYAPQTFRDESGRRIMIGWAGMPDAEYDNEPTVKEGWQHVLTVPRELKFCDGRIYQKPVAELDLLRENKENVLSETRYEKRDFDKCFDMLINFENDYNVFRFKISDTLSDAALELRCESGEIVLEFTGEEAFSAGRGRKIRRLKIESIRNFRILADTSIVEIYLNDGEYVFTTRYYMNAKKNILFEADKSFCVEIYEINKKCIYFKEGLE